MNPDPAAFPDAALRRVGGLISTNMSCCSSASQLLERVSSPPPSYSTRRPEVRMIGNSLAIPLSTASLLHREADVGQAELLASGSVGYLRDQVDARRVDRLAMHRHRIGQVPGDGARLAVAVGRCSRAPAPRAGCRRTGRWPRTRRRHGRLPPIFSMIAISAAVRSSSQPSFFNTAIVNSG